MRLDGPHFQTEQRQRRGWIMPYSVALTHANVPGPNRKDAWFRDLSWWKLNKHPLSSFEDNWSLNSAPHEKDDL
jgi:hypothetical protein